MEKRKLKNLKIDQEIHRAVKEASIRSGLRIQAIIERAVVAYLDTMDTETTPEKPIQS